MKLSYAVFCLVAVLAILGIVEAYYPRIWCKFGIHQWKDRRLSYANTGLSGIGKQCNVCGKAKIG